MPLPTSLTKFKSMPMSMQHAHATRPYPCNMISMQHVHIMQHVHVHAKYPIPCCMPMFMQQVHVHTKCLWSLHQCVCLWSSCTSCSTCTIMISCFICISECLSIILYVYMKLNCFITSKFRFLIKSISSLLQKYVRICGEPAISHGSHNVSLVQWTNLFASCHKGPRFKSPGGT